MPISAKAFTENSDCEGFETDWRKLVGLHLKSI